MAPSLFPAKQLEAKKTARIGPVPEEPPKPVAPQVQRTEIAEFITFDEPPLMDDNIVRRTPQEIFKVIKDLLTKRFNDVERMFYELDEINSMRLSQEQMFQLLRR